jgi:hypothetical protein
MYINEPDKIIMNFLRSKLSELSRTTPSLSDRQTTDSQSFSGNTTTTIFTLTTQPIAINSVVLDTVTLVPYQDYNIDLENKKIKFRSAPGNGTNNIVVSFEKGSNWIFPDFPRDELSKNKYPRIGFSPITESAIFKEVGGTNTMVTVTFQFDILTYKDLICTVGSDTIEGPDITSYLARQLINTIKAYWSSDLIYKIRGMNFISNNPIPFDEEKNIFRRVVELGFVFVNIEEVI